VRIGHRLLGVRGLQPKGRQEALGGLEFDLVSRDGGGDEDGAVAVELRRGGVLGMYGSLLKARMGWSELFLKEYSQSSAKKYY
jgi:hypothetical protein